MCLEPTAADLDALYRPSDEVIEGLHLYSHTQPQPHLPPPPHTHTHPYPRPHPHLFPRPLQIYTTINNGVYVAGFSTSQAAYDAAVTALHASLAQMDSRLEDTRFLMGDRWVGR